MKIEYFSSQVRDKISDICISISQVVLAATVVEPIATDTAHFKILFFGIVSILSFYWFSILIIVPIKHHD